MKAAELLRLYEAGERNFRGANLRGQNFKGQNLSDADFSGADIRSANFTNANLTGAHFTQAKAGLQRRWAIGLLIVSFFLSAIPGFFSSLLGSVVSLIFATDRLENQVGGWVALVILVAFFIIVLCKGIVTGAVVVAFAFAFAGTVIVAVTGTGAVSSTAVGLFAGAVVGAVAVVVTVAVTVADAVAVAGAVAGTGAVISAAAGATAGVVAVADIVTSAGTDTDVVTGAVAAAGAITVAGASVGAGTFTLLSAYVGWRALNGDKRDAWVRAVAITVAAIGGTSFRRADLTNVNFTQARLKSTDLRRARLICTCFRDSERLDRLRPGNSYLDIPEIRQLMLTRNGQGQSFDRSLNLEGINLQSFNLIKVDFTGARLESANLQRADLTNAILTGANLDRVNLQDADLSNAKLVQAQLDQADLTGATLTGAYIEDWNITTRTQLNGIRCDYVFMRLPPAGSPDPNPHRKPDDWNKTFAEGEFVDFIAPLVETLDLYHNQAVDPRAVAIAFNGLREQHPEAELDIVSMEKRGKHRDKLLLRAEVRPQANLSELHSQYFERYEHLLTLSPQAIQALLMEKDKQVKMLARMVDTAIDRPSQTFVSQYHNEGDITVSEQGSNAPKYDLSNAQFAGGFAETVKGNQIGGTINNYVAEVPSLAEAAAEIQNLLKQLEAANPTATEAEQAAFLNVMIPPTRRERFISALTAAGGAALDEIPYGPVLKALVGGWKKPNG